MGKITCVSCATSLATTADTLSGTMWRASISLTPSLIPALSVVKCPVLGKLTRTTFKSTDKPKNFK